MPSLITVQASRTRPVAGQGCLLTVAMPQVPPSDPSEIQPECSREQLNSRIKSTAMGPGPTGVLVRNIGGEGHWHMESARHGLSQAPDCLSP